MTVTEAYGVLVLEDGTQIDLFSNLLTVTSKGACECKETRPIEDLKEVINGRKVVSVGDGETPEDETIVVLQCEVIVVNAEAMNFLLATPGGKPVETEQEEYGGEG